MNIVITLTLRANNGSTFKKQVIGTLAKVKELNCIKATGLRYDGCTISNVSVV